MYYKTGDFTHFHTRTGSHATKGSGRGTVWWNVKEPVAPPKVADARVEDSAANLKKIKRTLRYALAAASNRSDLDAASIKKRLKLACKADRAVKTVLVDSSCQ